MPRVILPLGPGIVDWNSGEAVFQKTMGGIVFSYEELQVGIKEDQRGETDVTAVTSGVVNPVLSVPLTNEELSRLLLCFGNATAALKVANPVGENISSRARRVIVKPIVNGIISTDPAAWTYLHKAFPRITMEWTWDNAGQRVTTVLFTAYPAKVSGVIDALFRVAQP